MTGIGARPDAGIAAFDQRQHEIGIPVSVIGVVFVFRMVVDGQLDVVLFDHLFQFVNGLGRGRTGFHGHTGDVHQLGKIKNPAQLRIVFKADYAIIHQPDAGRFQLAFGSAPDLRRRHVAERRGIVRTQFLPGIGFDHAAAGFFGFIDSFEKRIEPERIGLRSDIKTAYLAFVGNFRGPGQNRPQADRHQGQGPDQFSFHFHLLFWTILRFCAI